MTPPLETFVTALVALDAAADRYVALALDDPAVVGREVYEQAVGVALAECNGAASVVDAMLPLYLNDPPRGVVNALSQAVDRSAERVWGVYGQKLLGTPWQACERAQLVADHAYQTAMARYLSAVNRVVLEPRGYGVQLGEAA